MLINFRNAMMAGKRLPYDAELEYLESTGTQWIDTGVFPDLDTVSCSTELEILQGQPSGLYGLFGVRTVASSVTTTNCSIVANPAVPSVRTDWATYSDFNSFSYGQTLKFVCGPHSILNVNGVQYGNGAAKEQGQINYSFYIFAINSVGTAMTPCKSRCRCFKLYSNGVLVRDFIPVRKGTVGYMYDRVSKRLFGNAGTGDFVLGPDVVPVEWLESSGTQWIDTGFVADSDSGFRVSIMPQNVADRYFIGSRISSTNSRWLAGCYTGPSVYIGWNTNDFVPWTLNEKHEVENNFYNNKEKALDGTSIAAITIELESQAHSALLFAAYDPTANNRPSACKIYSADISYRTSLVRSFRPVRVGTGSTWEGAMMDVLTRRVYRNAGTGAFAYGNDLRYPIPSE